MLAVVRSDNGDESAAKKQRLDIVEAQSGFGQLTVTKDVSKVHILFFLFRMRGTQELHGICSGIGSSDAKAMSHCILLLLYIFDGPP